MATDSSTQSSGHSDEEKENLPPTQTADTRKSGRISKSRDDAVVVDDDQPANKKAKVNSTTPAKVQKASKAAENYVDQRLGEVEARLSAKTDKNTDQLAQIVQMLTDSKESRAKEQASIQSQLDDIRTEAKEQKATLEKLKTKQIDAQHTQDTSVQPSTTALAEQFLRQNPPAMHQLIGSGGPQQYLTPVTASTVHHNHIQIGGKSYQATTSPTKNSMSTPIGESTRRARVLRATHLDSWLGDSHNYTPGASKPLIKDSHQFNSAMQSMIAHHIAAHSQYADMFRAYQQEWADQVLQPDTANVRPLVELDFQIRDACCGMLQVGTGDHSIHLPKPWTLRPAGDGTLERQIQYALKQSKVAAPPAAADKPRSNKDRNGGDKKRPCHKYNGMNRISDKTVASSSTCSYTESTCRWAHKCLQCHAAGTDVAHTQMECKEHTTPTAPWYRA